MKLKLTVLLVALGLAACGDASHGVPMLETEEGGVGDLLVNYSESIAPIIANRCSGCHFEGSGLSTFNSYLELTGRVDSVAFRVLERMNMPPRSAPQLTDLETELLLQWLEQGLPE